jgi:hypothetical protein
MRGVVFLTLSLNQNGSQISYLLNCEGDPCGMLKSTTSDSKSGDCAAVLMLALCSTGGHYIISPTTLIED